VPVDLSAPDPAIIAEVFACTQELPLNTMSRGFLFFVPILLLPVLLTAQEPETVEPIPSEPVPSELATSELERSRTCVPVLTRLAALEAELNPLAERAQRIGALNQAIGLEDRGRVAPLALEDPLEAAVDRWFERDEELALAYADSGDDAVLTERNAARQAMRDQLREAFEAVNAQAAERMEAEGELGEAAQVCDGAILVRSAVLEVCEGSAGPVCAEARNRELAGAGRYRFVDAPEDLWDMEQLRPWTDPSPLLPSPEGGLAGAQTGTLLRRGNLTFVLSLETLIQDRSLVDDAEAAEFDAHLDELGIEFDDPRFVMTPALAVALDITTPLGGETHYLLHFGDLSDPPNQVFWTVPASGNGPIQGLFPAPGWVLLQLAQGAEVSLTAVQIPEGEPTEGQGMEAEAVFTLELTSVGQMPAVTALLSYMASGDLAQDLARLIPPETPGER